MKEVIITSPSLNPLHNVSGVSSVVSFIIENNPSVEYVHFQIGKKDTEGGGLQRIKRVLQTFLAWKKLLKEYPAALIHYSFPLSSLSIMRDFVFMNFCMKHRRRIVVHVHGGVFLNAVKTPIVIRFILKKIFSWTVPFIVLSETEESIIRRRYHAGSINVLPNCIDLTDAESFIRVTDSADEKPLTLGYLGRIETNKGMNELLQASRTLKEKKVCFMLKIAGKEEVEGQFLPSFTRELGDCFEYSGIVCGESKNKFLRSLDILLFPSYFEGLPMSVLECMSYGVVPVVTPVGSIPAAVKDGVNGLYAVVRDADSITEQVLRLDADRQFMHKLGKNARAAIFNNYSTDGYIVKLNRIYETV